VPKPQGQTITRWGDNKRLDDPSQGSDRIIEAAEDCFRERGVKQATMQQIAERARITRATLYKYFPNKSALLQEIVRREANTMIDGMLVSVSTNQSFADYLSECLVHVIFSSLDNRLVNRKTSGYYELPLEFFWQDVSDQLRQRWLEIFRPHFDDALKNSVIRADIDLQTIVDWYGRIANSFLLQPREGLSRKALQKEIDCFFIQGLLTR